MSSPNKTPRKNDKNQKNDKQSSRKFLSIILWAVVIVLMFNTCASTLENATTIQVSYADFREWVGEGYVSEADLKSGAVYFKMKPGTPPLQEISTEMSESLSKEQKELFTKLSQIS